MSGSKVKTSSNVPCKKSQYYRDLNGKFFINELCVLFSFLIYVVFCTVSEYYFVLLMKVQLEARSVSFS